MRNTTALSLRGTLVSLTRGSSTFLRHGLLTATSDVPEVLGLLQNVAILILPVVEHILDNVASQGQIVYRLV